MPFSTRFPRTLFNLDYSLSLSLWLSPRIKNRSARLMALLARPKFNIPLSAFKHTIRSFSILKAFVKSVYVRECARVDVGSKVSRKLTFIVLRTSDVTVFLLTNTKFVYTVLQSDRDCRNNGRQKSRHRAKLDDACTDNYIQCFVKYGRRERERASSANITQCMQSKAVATEQ